MCQLCVNFVSAESLCQQEAEPRGWNWEPDPRGASGICARRRERLEMYIVYCSMGGGLHYFPLHRTFRQFSGNGWSFGMVLGGEIMSFNRAARDRSKFGLADLRSDPDGKQLDSLLKLRPLSGKQSFFDFPGRTVSDVDANLVPSAVPSGSRVATESSSAGHLGILLWSERFRHLIYQLPACFRAGSYSCGGTHHLHKLLLLRVLWQI